MPQSLRKQAEAKREKAARVRQMAATLAHDSDRQRIMRQAEALESEAAALEGQAAERNDD
jgi:hypothetical protein